MNLFPGVILPGVASASPEFFWYFHETYPEATIVKDLKSNEFCKRYPHFCGSFTKFRVENDGFTSAGVPARKLERLPPPES